ncbi:MAG: hypothetical protein J7K48_02255 [Thermococcus sp.]|uniref:Membrane protein n=1 Tax=Thermococcus guaymasensis DSM 11113 TaxID=1432656 RepID=A0A0X1KLL1_9EURY|nr:hypothetical protein [Thermococcus guaymasensis]AJC72144.1 membrane protein [Thermococcus guaymasensis DSM 11113]MCD6523806.1 hypothetical protein [Thermococcus sp.]
MRELYKIFVILTAIFIFWPVLYGSVEALRRIPGDPTLQAVMGTLIFGLLAYATYEEDTEKEELTAS